MRRSQVVTGDEPQWQHGYRCQGYWVGVVRWGYVGLGPASHTNAKRDGYGWGFSPNGGTCNDAEARGWEGRCKTLREGKRIVEAKYREWNGRA